jgi:hypothetical protein
MPIMSMLIKGNNTRHHAIERYPVIVAGCSESTASRRRPDDQIGHRRAMTRIAGAGQQ